MKNTTAKKPEGKVKYVPKRGDYAKHFRQHKASVSWSNVRVQEMALIVRS